MTKYFFQPLICLLAFLIVFTKYGEAISKFMSIGGDIDFAFIENEVEETDVIGFLFDNKDGGFFMNSSLCGSSPSGDEAFKTELVCSVTSKKSRPIKAKAYVKHEADFPEMSTGANLMVGLQDIHGPYEKQFVHNGVAVDLSFTQTNISKENSQLYCNNKDHTHYKPLFKFDGSEFKIYFKDSDIGQYEQTMKCVVIFKKSTKKVFAQRMFVFTISNIPYKPFTFQPNRLNDRKVVQFVTRPSKTYARGIERRYRSENEKSNIIFLADSSRNCPSRLTLALRDYNEPPIYFYYKGAQRLMPAIDYTSSSSCGIASITSQNGSEPLVKYFCNCRGNIRYVED